jgi:hypothetical protein
LAETAAIIVTIPIWGYVMHKLMTRLQTGFGLIAALHASSYIDNDVAWMVKQSESLKDASLWAMASPIIVQVRGACPEQTHSEKYDVIMGTPFH